MSDEQVLVGRYRLVRELGAGAMGTVWLARDMTLHREVAVKRVVDPMTPQLGKQAEMARLRAMREGRIAARLSHPNAVGIYDVAIHEGQPWLVMEYVPSRTLTEIVQAHGPIPPQRAALLGMQIASALAEAHRVGIVHRDVKPSNLLLTEQGEAKLTDFGIARGGGDATLTASGLVTGTPAYFAPELARGADAAPASDVWSLGATLFFAVEGAPPFGNDDNPLLLLGRVANQPVPLPRRAGDLTSMVLRLLDRDASRRPTMVEARSMLAALSRGTETIPLALLEEELGTEQDNLQTEQDNLQTEQDELQTEQVRIGAAAGGVPDENHEPSEDTEGPADEDVPQPVAEDAEDGTVGAGGGELTQQAEEYEDGELAGQGTGSAEDTADASTTAVQAADADGAEGPNGEPGHDLIDNPIDEDGWDGQDRTGAATTELAASVATSDLDTPGATGDPADFGGAGDFGNPDGATVPTEPGEGEAQEPTDAETAGTTAHVRGADTDGGLAKGAGGGAPGDGARAAGTWIRRRRRPLVAALVLVVLAAVGGSLALGAGGEPGETSEAGRAEERGGDGTGKQGSDRTQDGDRSSRRSEEGRSSDPGTATPTPTPSRTPEQGAQMTASAMEQLVAEYYRLLPSDTDAGWSMLGPELRSTGMDDYEGWWSLVESVTVSDLEADPDNATVTGTVRFVMEDGGPAPPERHHFGIVISDDGERLLINTDSAP